MIKKMLSLVALLSLPTATVWWFLTGKHKDDDGHPSEVEKDDPYKSKEDMINESMIAKGFKPLHGYGNGTKGNNAPITGSP